MLAGWTNAKSSLAEAETTLANAESTLAKSEDSAKLAKDELAAAESSQKRLEAAQRFRRCDAQDALENNLLQQWVCGDDASGQVASAQTKLDETQSKVDEAQRSLERVDRQIVPAQAAVNQWLIGVGVVAVMSVFGLLALWGPTRSDTRRSNLSSVEEPLPTEAREAITGRAGSGESSASAAAVKYLCLALGGLLAIFGVVNLLNTQWGDGPGGAISAVEDGANILDLLLIFGASAGFFIVASRRGKKEN